MTTPDQPDHTHAFPADISQRWEGHMYDGLATTYGPRSGAVLWANADALWVNGNRGSFFIPCRNIVELRRGRLYPWFFQGVRIVHTRADLPETIVFLPTRQKTRSLLDQLRQLSYPVR